MPGSGAAGMGLHDTGTIDEAVPSGADGLEELTPKFLKGAVALPLVVASSTRGHEVLEG